MTNKVHESYRNRTRARNNARVRKWVKNNRERHNANAAEWRKNHPEYREYQSNWVKNNRERVRELQRNWLVNNPAKYLFKYCRNSARQNNREFSLTVEWISKKLEAGVCEQTGLPFIFEKIFNKCCPFFPSIDRIDSSRGYTETNCQVVCTIYNLAKRDWSDIDVFKMAKALVKKYYERDALA